MKHLLFIAIVLIVATQAVRAQIYVTGSANGTVGEYNNTSGAGVNPSFVAGLNLPAGIAVSGSNLYVANYNNGTIGEYNATTGAVINPALVTGLINPYAVAISGSSLYVANFNGSGTIGEYNATTGAVMNPALVTGPSDTYGIAVSGSSLYVTNYTAETISEYNATTGTVMNASLVTGLSSPTAIAISGSNLYVANTSAGTIGEYNATTGAVVNASRVTGLNNPQAIAVLGSNLFVASQTTGMIGEYNATTGAVVNTSLVSGLGSPDGIAVTNTGPDLSSVNVQKAITYDQSSAGAPVLDPETPYQFYTQINPGSTGALLPFTTLTSPSGSTGTVAYQASSNGLQFTEDFQTQAALDTAYQDGTYNLTIQTTTPNTYFVQPVLSGDNYPLIPQIVNLTNATWSGGHLMVTDPTQPVTITWPAFTSDGGNIFFNINNTGLGQSLPSDGEHNSITIPGNTLTTNTFYQGSINFSNFTPTDTLPGVSAGASYATQVNFIIQVGNPPAASPTLYDVQKSHVLVQTSNNAPANGSGDNDAYDPAPFALSFQSPVAGSVTGPSASYTVAYDTNENGGTGGNYDYSSGAVTSQSALDSTYPNGNYLLTDGNTVSLSGNSYPNAPQITLVNGGTPVWNSQGQLVLDPTIANTITWTTFNISAATFASNGSESVHFQSDGDGLVNLKVETGITTGTPTAFNTLTIPVGTMTAERTYVGKIQYLLTSTFNTVTANVFDAAGYGTETCFTAIAASSGSLAQTINVPVQNLEQVIGTSLALSATATSGLPVTYTLVSGPATLTGDVLAFTGLGAVTVNISQPGNGTYAPATTLSYTYTVNSTATSGQEQFIIFPGQDGPQPTTSPITLQAVATSGLPITYTLVSGPAILIGDVLTFTGTGGVQVNADQPGNGSFMAAATASQSFDISAPDDVGNFTVQKQIQYEQSSASAPTLDPEETYNFFSYVNLGSSGFLLSTSTLTPPAGGAGTTVYTDAGSNGLRLQEDFQTKAALDAAYSAGTYNLSLQTTTPSAYTAAAVLGSDNYPVIPQVTGLTNATWSGGVLLVTNAALPVTITWTTFNSATGNINFNIDNTGISQNFSANGTNNSVTIPGGTLANNSIFNAELNFQNNTNSNAIPGVNGSTGYANQLNFTIQVGTPVPPTATLYAVQKSHVLVQTSNSAPVDGSGDNDDFDPAPYEFYGQSPVAGSITGPGSTTRPLSFESDGGESGAFSYDYSSGALTSLSILNTTYADGSYTLADGHIVSLTGDAYPIVPQITLVNGATPIWNGQGQLVLDPTVTNTITWTAINQNAGTFASNGHEEVHFQSDNGDNVNFKQQAGITETSTTSFNTETIPANTLTTNHTYVGKLNYLLASSISNIGSVYDAAGYQTETVFMAIAEPLPNQFDPSFNSGTDIGISSNGYNASGIALTLNLNFAPTPGTTLTVVNNTGSGPISGTFSNVPEGGSISASFDGTPYSFTGTYKGGDGNDMILTYTPAFPPSALSIIHNFQDGSVPNDGANPFAGLVQGTDGNFYGTTYNGGDGNGGSLFKITPQGAVTILHGFGDDSVENDAMNPDSALVQGNDGNFYGTAPVGGASNEGCVYQATPQGQITILHSFGDGSVGNDGLDSQGGLIQGSDGNFYGMTVEGGSAGDGVVYKITPQGLVTILHSFGDGSVLNDGQAPRAGLIQGSDGNFYGTTSGGGPANSGTVFKITPQGQVTILHSFQDGSVANDGAVSNGSLIQGSDGNFYGMTDYGGSNPTIPFQSGTSFTGDGTIYKITPQGQVTILHSFNDGSVPNDGQLPFSNLIQGSDGNFYGTTQAGGSGGSGILFKSTPQGVVTILHSFNDGSVPDDGDGGNTLIQGSDGNFYSATGNGGAASVGTVFKFTPTLPILTSSLNVTGTVGIPFSYATAAMNTPTSYSATNLPAGLSINPTTGLITGTPTTAGTNSCVLTLSNGAGPASVLLNIAIAALPTPVVTSSLNAYGSVGTAFSYAVTASNNPTSYSATGLPHGLTITTSTGVISGTPTSTGTTSVTLNAGNGSGTGSPMTLMIHIMSSVPTAGQEYNILYQFSGASTGDAQNPNVIFQGFDGTFYGLSSGGGSAGAGTVFNTTVQGNTSIFHSFGTGNGDGLGSAPQGLIQAADGNFYGTTFGGGSVGLGTVFKITPQGTVTVLHNFGDGSVANDGSSPQAAGLIQASDGNFYGTTQSGGSKSLGAIYKITPLGTVTLLHSFGDGSVGNDGSSPMAGLIQGVDGNLYGTTQLGGSHGAGILFKMTTLGAMTVLHSFQDGSVSNDGANPIAPLLQGANGNFYGATQNGGAHSDGALFQMTTSGTVATLHSFAGMASDDGANPVAPLIQGYDGNFYGMTSQGGSANKGTVFEMNSTGTVTLIHQFADGSVPNDGTFPNATLCQGTDGNFYGTTSSGGAGFGTVFSIVTTQATNHAPIFTGATTFTAAALSPLSFTPQAEFGVSVSGSGITGDSLQAALVSFFSQLVTKDTSGAGVTDWIESGTLPNYLTFDSTSGTLTGTPIQPGIYTITMTANNAAGTGTTETITLFIEVAPILTSATTASGSVNTAFSYQIAANASPTSFGATGLPGWLSVNTTTGVISGTPPGTGTFIFSPTATNLSGTGTEQVVLTVGSSAITSATTASCTPGAPFSYQITATGSPASYSAVSLPPGLLFNATTGIISGTPTTAGSYLVPIGVTYVSGSSSSSVLTLTVNPVSAPVITSSTSITVTPSTPISYQIAGTNSPIIFAAVGLPAGLSLNTTTGVITGTPASAGNSMVTLSATNGIGTGTATLALAVGETVPPPVISSATNASGTATLPFSYQIVASNSPGSYGATGLPAGLTIDPTTGLITGTPTAFGTGTSNVTLSATTAAGTGTAALTITISAPTFSQWESSYGISSSATATPEKDGVPNLLKYLYDINPTEPMTTSDRGALPSLGTTKSGGIDYLTLTYRQYSLENGITINVQTSSDLKTWSLITPDYIQQLSTDANNDSYYQIGVRITGATRQFLRLNVTQP